MRIAIRSGRVTDWDAMRRVFLEAARAAWGHILPASTLADLRAPERWRPGHGADVVLIEREGEVLGFVCIRPSADDDAGPEIAEVDACYTHPAVWGMGIGQALLSAAVARLAAEGFREATLWTDYRSERPLRFYRAAGWKLDGAERRRTFGTTELRELRHRISIP